MNLSAAQLRADRELPPQPTLEDVVWKGVWGLIEGRGVQAHGVRTPK